MVTLSNDLKDLLESDLEEVANETIEDFSESNEYIENSLSGLLTPHFPDVEVYTFGSREIGVATEDSDLDLFIDTDDSFYTLGLEKNIGYEFSKVKQLLVRSNEWSHIKIVEAKVPLIQAYHKGEGVHCDISFSDGMGYSNTELITYFCELEPIMPRMIIILRIWLDRAANLSTQISNYTLTLLVINYLQHYQYLPSVKALQEGIDQPDNIGPWIVEIDKENVEYLNLYSPNDLDEVLMNFFKFYSSISKFDKVICTYLGVLAPKLYFLEPGVKSLKRYFTFVNRYPNEAYVFSAMNVQGPYNLADNPTKQVSVTTLQKFVNFCGASYNFMNSE